MSLATLPLELMDEIASHASSASLKKLALLGDTSLHRAALRQLYRVVQIDSVSVLEGFCNTLELRADVHASLRNLTINIDDSFMFCGQLGAVSTRIERLATLRFHTLTSLATRSALIMSLFVSADAAFPSLTSLAAPLFPELPAFLTAHCGIEHLHITCTPFAESDTEFKEAMIPATPPLPRLRVLHAPEWLVASLLLATPHTPLEKLTIIWTHPYARFTGRLSVIQQQFTCECLDHICHTAATTQLHHVGHILHGWTAVDPVHIAQAFPHLASLSFRGAAPVAPLTRLGSHGLPGADIEWFSARLRAALPLLEEIEQVRLGFEELSPLVEEELDILQEDCRAMYPCLEVIVEVK
ncbi:hypothetical protein MIND_01237100 [Mycena indigotica]|uniref:F-box domain-containing protein n=1 Tax=Mycena indigotica TaxID=2126181 RepID=A0A8H6VXS9_9AGAR|nr:uncharacterized protein MIND_01237100 [Mycena indigotica]KAF7292104.1 hypothetical protein MIND_01237100 [Mycena indigotica]